MTQHTPGPWTLDDSHDDLTILDSKTIIANVDGITFPKPSKIAKANARLIAAAPELLAALQWIADHGDTGAGGRPAFHDMRDHARKAINQAEGRP